MEEWNDPDRMVAFAVCMKRKFADDFMSKGSIKFNSPQRWTEIAKQGDNGKGDILEGTYAACSSLDFEAVAAYSNMYKDSYGETFGGLTYFRRRSSMQLPCWCMYGLKQGLFSCPNHTGIQTLSGMIPGSYFQDFNLHHTKEENEALPDEEKPCLIIIDDFNKFISRFKAKLLNMGLSANDYSLSNRITYWDKDKPFYLVEPSPAELKVKGNQFKDQSEYRIIINTTNSTIQTKLLNETIDIGAMVDIAKKVDGYFYDGILVDLNVMVKSVGTNS